MDAVDLLPVVIGHLLEADVAQDAGVVDDDVEAAEGVESGLDKARAVFDRVVVGDGLAAGGLNLGYDAVGGRRARALTVHTAAQVVDDDAGPARGQ